MASSRESSFSIWLLLVTLSGQIYPCIYSIRIIVEKLPTVYFTITLFKQRKTRMSQRKRIEPGPGQESLWDYPRPPRLEQSNKHIQVIFNGVVIADTRRAKRILETSHPPVYYIPPEDVKLAEHFMPVQRTTFCEWKGAASY